MIAPIEASKAILRVSQTGLWTALSVASIGHEVGPMRRSLVAQYLRLGDHLQILMLLAQVLVFYHHFTNGRLLCEVELVDTLIKEFTIDVVQRNDDLRAN